VRKYQRNSATLESDRGLATPNRGKITQILQNVKDRASQVERLFADCGKWTCGLKTVISGVF
jgi:hypothetical protein